MKPNPNQSVKLLTLALSLCAWSASACDACAQTSLAIPVNFTTAQWEALTNKLAAVNASLATKYSAELAAWKEESSQTRKLNLPNPPPPVPVVLSVEQYLQRLATGQPATTRALPPTKSSRSAPAIKTFPYTLPGTSIVFTNAVVGPKATIVINHREGTLFGDWDIYESEAKRLAGDLPVGKISKTFAGEEVEALKTQHAGLLTTLYDLAKSIGESVVGAKD